MNSVTPARVRLVHRHPRRTGRGRTGDVRCTDWSRPSPGVDVRGRSHASSKKAAEIEGCQRAARREGVEPGSYNADPIRRGVDRKHGVSNCYSSWRGAGYAAPNNLIESQSDPWLGAVDRHGTFARATSCPGQCLSWTRPGSQGRLLVGMGYFLLEGCTSRYGVAMFRSHE
jgi:hypothetical protein